MPATTNADLLHLLSDGASSAPALMDALGVSQPTLWRQLQTAIKEERVLRIGSTKGARYALRKQIAGAGSMWPLHRIDVDGRVQLLGHLYALAADQYFFETGPAAEGALLRLKLSHGLPYFLQDQRPAGFMGRSIPSRYPQLNLPQRVADWTDDHYLRYLTQHGVDAMGDLILGEAPLAQTLADRQQEPIKDLQREFPLLLRKSLESGVPGSSAHGEHPKFPAFIRTVDGDKHVLVKFSPPIGNPIGQRWSDLLIAEHLAHVILNDAGISTCRSRIHRFDNHTYLEVERFDRSGLRGRLGVTSLFAIDMYFHGELDHWIAAATRLQRDGMIDASTAEQIRLVHTFGALIGNNDRHFGNLAFYDRYDGPFTLAPIYDMLPMLFAPEHNQIIAREFAPPSPTSDTAASYPRARHLAEEYWRTVIADERISDDFNGIARTCLDTLEALPPSGAAT